MTKPLSLLSAAYDPAARPCRSEWPINPARPPTRVGRRGSGVHPPERPDTVAKVYHQAADHPDRREVGGDGPRWRTPAAGIGGVANGPAVSRPNAQLAGFVMPRLSDCEPIQHLYNPVQRLKYFPRAGWDFQVRAAANLAAAFDEIHKAGCLIGDVNQSNVLVSTQALVRLIDCDSFQVRANGRQYLCEVGVVHYTPPELQGKSLRGLVRTENHDRFGLAVLIYQLLFVGRHPYAGVYCAGGDPSFEQLIAEFRFAQGPAAHTWGMAPPPHTPTFADIPPELGTLFRRAFERGAKRAPGRGRRVAGRVAATRTGDRGVQADAGHKYWRGAVMRLVPVGRPRRAGILLRRGGRRRHFRRGRGEIAGCTAAIGKC